MSKIFNSKADEKQVTKAILDDWTKLLESVIESDVVIAGAGPSGLVCARALALQGLNVLIVESNNYLGGGFWIGGYLMNTITVRSPADTILLEVGAPMKPYGEGLYTASGPYATSKLIAAACDSGVKFLNMTSVDDVVLDEAKRVNGLVINWTPIRSLPRAIACLDPVAIETKFVVDATGHDAHVIRSLSSRGLLNLPGCGPMSVVASEEAVVEKTGEVYPGLWATGMAVSSAYGLPRMGPTFGSMLLSGQKAASQILTQLGKE